ncbi:MAG TPA: pilin [bacterium]|nr:pilin [bacterium]HPL95666.1 pilin [bacterium]
MNKSFKKFLYIFLFLVLVSPVMVGAVETVDDPFGTANLGNIRVPQETSDLPTIVSNVINIILGLLALVAIVIILIAGFEWMTAGGNDDKVKTAQKRLKYGLFGLVIIFLAYGIVTWVLSTLNDVGTTGGVL